MYSFLDLAEMASLRDPGPEVCSVCPCSSRLHFVVHVRKTTKPQAAPLPHAKTLRSSLWQSKSKLPKSWVVANITEIKSYGENKKKLCFGRAWLRSDKTQGRKEIWFAIGSWRADNLISHLDVIPSDCEQHNLTVFSSMIYLMQHRPGRCCCCCCPPTLISKYTKYSGGW